MPVARGQAKRPFVLNDIPAFTALLLHQKCGRATPRGEAQWICRYERAPLTIARIENRITPACPYILPSARRRSAMAARQVRRSVVMSNLRVGLLPMDSDQTPLGKGKDVLHGATRAAPLRQSVEQPWQRLSRGCPKSPCRIRSSGSGPVIVNELSPNNPALFGHRKANRNVDLSLRQTEDARRGDQVDPELRAVVAERCQPGRTKVAAKAVR